MLVERLILERMGPFERLDLEFRPGRDPEQADVHLLVGPNGCGKTTILYALAHLCAWGQASPILQRRWDDDFTLALRTDGRWNDVVLRGGQRVKWTPPDGQPSVGEPVEALVVAYSGYRQLPTSPLGAIREPEPPSAADAISFGEVKTDRLKQWVANRTAKAALAYRRGDKAVAEAREATVSLLESCLKEVVGSPVAFRLEEDPLDVRLCVGDRPLDFQVLPDGLRSVLSWLGDLLMRLEHSKKEASVELTRQPFVLLLDEIEVHLHPAWQRRVVPAVQSLFPNAQIFIATHSPFVVASADDAWVYPFRVDDGGLAHSEPPLPSQLGHSYAEVLQDVFGVSSDFDPDTQDKLDRFIILRDRALRGENVEHELEKLGHILAARSAHLASIVGREQIVIARSRRKPA